MSFLSLYKYGLQYKIQIKHFGVCGFNKTSYFVSQHIFLKYFAETYKLTEKKVLTVKTKPGELRAAVIL